MTDGGYDSGYNACPCFWGREPSSLVTRLVRQVGSVAGWRVLDAGCGEGKNAAYLAALGADVHAIDISASAIKNARQAWGERERITWESSDIRTFSDNAGLYDLIIAYGLLHCMPDEDSVTDLTNRLQTITRPKGYHVMCTFNSRSQDLSAHPGFCPTLLSHQAYLDLYESWNIVIASDTDLHEIHPTNNIPHMHSMTRIIAQRSSPPSPRRS